MLVERETTSRENCGEKMDQFLQRCFYHSGQYDSKDDFAELDKKLKEHEFCLRAWDFHMDTGSPVGALVSEDVNRSDDLKQLYPEPSQCTCFVLEDVSLNELGNKLTEFLHIQDDKKLASGSSLVQLADKTDNFNVEKGDKCKDLDQAEPTTVTSEKFFPKYATFACSGKKASLAVSANVEDNSSIGGKWP